MVKETHLDISEAHSSMQLKKDSEILNFLLQNFCKNYLCPEPTVRGKPIPGATKLVWLELKHI
jgi:hypothetical protein